MNHIKTLKNTLVLTFRGTINIDGHTYILPIIPKLLKTIINVLFVMGSFLFLGTTISIISQKFNVTIPFEILILFLFLIIISINFFITYFSSWKKVV